jgi:hypothetical protein
LRVRVSLEAPATDSTTAEPAILKASALPTSASDSAYARQREPAAHASRSANETARSLSGGRGLARLR